MTRYGHCSKLLVKKGEKIKQGQKIAEVGETRTCNRTTFTSRNMEREKNSKSRIYYEILIIRKIVKKV